MSTTDVEDLKICTNRYLYILNKIRNKAVDLEKEGIKMSISKSDDDTQSMSINADDVMTDIIKYINDIFERLEKAYFPAFTLIAESYLLEKMVSRKRGNIK